MTRPNRLAETLDAGDVAVGASSSLYSPTVIEIFGELNLDYVFLDFEHNGTAVWDSLDFEELTRAADTAEVSLVVRLPSGGPETHPPLIRKVLDTGVRNLVVPRVETVKEVRHIVAATQFAYDGKPGDRGIGGGRGNAWGADVDADWLDREDRAIRCGVMIENTTAVERLEEILSVPNLGFVFIGSSDLSVSLNQPLAFDNPEFRQTIERIRSVCRSSDIPFGQLGAGIEWGQETVEEGGQFLHIGSDLGAIRDSLSRTAATIDY